MDRDKGILDIITYILTESGYRVLSLLNDEGILNQIQKFTPDALLLEIMNPSVEGTAICRAIKTASGTKHIPIIVLSTHPKLTDIKGEYVDDVLPKPFDIDELLNIIEHLTL